MFHLDWEYQNYATYSKKFKPIRFFSELSSQLSFYGEVYEQYENILITTKLNFDNFTKEFLDHVRNKTMPIPWVWRRVPHNVAAMQHIFGILHDKHNPHLAHMTRVFLLIQESGLLKATYPTQVVSKLDDTVNPYELVGVSYASEKIRYNALKK